MTKITEIDVTFKAHCPVCGNKLWIYTNIAAIRMCSNVKTCRYLHQLTALDAERPAIIPAVDRDVLVPSDNAAVIAKKKRVRQLVKILIVADPLLYAFRIQKTIELAVKFDEAIEAVQ